MSSGKRLADATKVWTERIAAAKDELRAVVAGPPPKQLLPVQLPYPVRPTSTATYARTTPLTQPSRALSNTVLTRAFYHSPHARFQAWVAEFGEFLLTQKAQEAQGSDDQTPSGRDARFQGLLQAFKAMVKLSTGQGVRPIRATDAVPFAAGVRLSLHANTKVVQHLSESYMQASRPR
jgi:hypothetical protein|tara:strand:- start:99 stop:632 length:534 start_codon:yes stop_codon:yes gene_type:complete